LTKLEYLSCFNNKLALYLTSKLYFLESLILTVSFQISIVFSIALIYLYCYKEKILRKSVLNNFPVFHINKWNRNFCFYVYNMSKVAIVFLNTYHSITNFWLSI